MADPIIVPIVTTPAKPVAAVEPVPVAQTPPPPDPKLLQEQFGKLVQREKATLAERQKLAEDKRALDAERAQHAQYMKELEEFRKFKAGAKTDPDSFLRSIYGEDWYTPLTEFKLDKKPPPSLEVAALRDEMSAWKSEQAKERERQAAETKERELAAQRETKERWAQSATAHVKAAGEKYELINLLGYHDHVPSLIEEHWLKQKDVPEAERKILSVDEAAQMVDDWLAKQWESMAKSKRLTEPRTVANTPASKTPEGISRDARTISNGLTPSSAPPPAKARTEQEREKAALAAYEAAKARKRN